MPLLSKVTVGILITLAALLGTESQVKAEPREGDLRPWHMMALIEARPAPRLGAAFEQAGFGQERWVHTLSFGMGVLGDIELRTAALFRSSPTSYPLHVPHKLQTV